MKSRLWLFVALLIAGILFAASLLSGAPPESEQIFFSKSFPGSTPKYFEITVDAAGRVAYREEAGEEPLEFQLSEKQKAEVYSLAKKIAHFQKSLQTDRKVAFTGKKTLRYTSAAGETSETEFDYSANSDAQAIVVWFENAGETERYRIELERVVQFDPLGVNKALLQFQTAFDDGRVVGAQQFLPILKTISEQQKFMHMSRARAASLIERIGRQQP